MTLKLVDLEKFRATRDLASSRFNPRGSDADLADDPRLQLRRALQAIGEASRAVPVFDSAGILENASVNLAAYITLAFPGTGDEPLLVEILREAFVAYDRASRRSATSAACIAAYLGAIASGGGSVLRYQVTGSTDDGQTSPWMPWAAGLRATVKERGWVQLAFRPAQLHEFDAQAAPDFILTRILSAREYGRYKAIAADVG